MVLSQALPALPEGSVVRAVYTPLGDKTKALMGLAYTSIVLSSITIVVVLYLLWRRHIYGHISFRLSLTIALADLVYAIVQCCYNNTHIIQSLTPAKVRVLLLFHLMSLGVFVFSSTCIAFHLHMTSILNCQKITATLSPYYELASWVVAFIFSQPLLYIGDAAVIPDSGLVLLIESSRRKMCVHATLIYMVVLLCIPYCFAVCVMVLARVLSFWRKAHSGSEDIINPKDMARSMDNEFYGQGGSGWTYPFESVSGEALPNAPTTGTALLATKLRGAEEARVPIHQSVMQQHRETQRAKRRRINFAIFRIMLYPLMPLFSTLPMYVFFLARNPSVEFGFNAMMLPVIAAIMNFALFICNPTFDDMWCKWWRSLRDRPKCSGGRIPKWRMSLVSKQGVSSPSQMAIRMDNQDGMSQEVGIHSNDSRIYVPFYGAEHQQL
ncbi:hypothetical protein EV182_002133 [Spiromyces aspiralis]|uniref:Uncharacterized protein n=1 Tax=Spiromyces aspiralis TaxID=68401 RepID=A0ACC1HGZ9_9FUNG|nr:hypothetical protein EV182_002133 [Spiromyces aspiralis]